MKQINTYITEKLKLNRNSGIKYNYRPQTRSELDKIIEKLLDERGPDADLNDIDVSAITNMSELFSRVDPRKIDISKWNVSNVDDMSHMFENCENFNSDLSSWNVSNVTDMADMFYNCPKFNSDLSKWDVSNVENMSCMFIGCYSLKTVPKWYTGRV